MGETREETRIEEETLLLQRRELLAEKETGNEEKIETETIVLEEKGMQGVLVEERVPLAGGVPLEDKETGVLVVAREEKVGVAAALEIVTEAVLEIVTEAALEIVTEITEEIIETGHETGWAKTKMI